VNEFERDETAQMDLTTFFEHFDTLAEAPNGIQRLRELILDMAVRGKLVPQDPADEPAAHLLKWIEQERQLLIKKKVTRKREINPILKDEQPYEIPVSWEWVMLCSIAHDLGQKRPDDFFSYIDVSAINNGVVDSVVSVVSPDEAPSRARKIVERGTVIYSTVRPYLLNIAVIDKEYDPEPIASTAFSVLHPYTGIDKKYLYYLLRSHYFIEYVERYQKGVAYPAISDTDLLRAPVPIPPVAGQKRIVAKVDELMGLCDALEAAQQTRNTLRQSLRTSALDALMTAPGDDELSTAWAFVRDNWDTMSDRPEDVEGLRQAVLNLAIRGKLNTFSQSDEHVRVLMNRARKTPVQYKAGKKDFTADSLNDEYYVYHSIPENWQWIRLRDLVLSMNNGLYKPARFYSKKGIASIRMFNIQNGQLTTKKLKRIEVTDEEYSNYELSDGDIIVNRVNSRELVGKAAVFDSIGEPAVFEAMNIRVRLIPQVSLPGYINLNLLENKIRNLFFAVAKQASGQASVSQPQVGSLPIPLPPLAEQKRIVAKVEELMQLCDQLETHLRQQQTQAQAFAASAVSALAA
jgi:type I restriction enzyme S subunit